jgi:RNA polymerase sigma-70 factor (ECF subfamily)
LTNLAAHSNRAAVISNSPYDQASLLHRIAAGDQAAFSLLFEQHADKLAAYLYKLTGNREEVKEIVQEVFIKIWLRRTDLPALDSIDNYLFILSRNAAYDLFRKKLTEKSLKDNLGRQDIPSAQNPEQASGFRQLQQLHARAIQQLPPQQQKVYLLSREEGLTHQQIATQIGIATETVKKHMMAALRSVRIFVRNHYELIISLLVFFR